MTALLAAGVGFLAGLHAATWGMYKDAPHEGFTLQTFVRSIVVATPAATALAAVAGLDPRIPADAVVLFGAVYTVERAVAELYKTFLREQDQSKYTIPMQFAVLGRVVEHRGLRALAGLAYGGLMAAVLLAIAAYAAAAGRTPLVAVLLLGGAGGWISAFGGAWKDAPVEGFQTFKFFRSPLVATAFALLVSRLTGDLVLITLAATGYTIAATETYKTFLFPSVPRGKFAGKPVRFPQMLRTRRWFVPAYVGIWMVVVLGFLRGRG